MIKKDSLLRDSFIKEKGAEPLPPILDKVLKEETSKKSRQQQRLYKMGSQITADNLPNIIQEDNHLQHSPMIKNTESFATVQQHYQNQQKFSNLNSRNIIPKYDKDEHFSSFSPKIKDKHRSFSPNKAGRKLVDSKQQYIRGSQMQMSDKKFSGPFQELLEK